MNNQETMPAEGTESVSVEKFQEMSPNARRDMVRGALQAKAGMEFSAADVDAIVNLTGRFLNSEKPDTVQNAVDLAAEIRLDAVKEIGSVSPSVYAADKEGSILASGLSPAEAMKKAQQEQAG